MAKVSVTKTIAAPAAKVWKMVSNWGGTHDWIPGVGPVTVSGTDVGATRSAELDPATGFPGLITESLDAFDEPDMYFRYSIVGDSPIPIKNYVAEMRVTALAGESCEVLWQSEWNAAGEISEDELLEAFNGLYQMALDNVQSACE